jgi:hypothetical protein
MRGSRSLKNIQGNRNLTNYIKKNKHITETLVANQTYLKFINIDVVYAIERVRNHRKYRNLILNLAGKENWECFAFVRLALLIFLLL